MITDSMVFLRLPLQRFFKERSLGNELAKKGNFLGTFSLGKGSKVENVP